MEKKKLPSTRGFSPKAKRNYDEIAMDLRKDPGEWYRIARNSKSQALGRAPLMARGCVVATRRPDEGDGWDIYARYEGPEM